MTKTLGIFIKLLIFLLVMAALAGLAFWMIKLKGWPWWFAAATVAGIIGLVLGFFYIKKYFLRRRERLFVSRVIEQDSAAINRLPVSQRHELQELQEHWRESVHRLQESHLRRRGNPLYVLPWFLIMGESRAGKTSAVKNARQNTPMSEISRSAGISGTRNCDWWFFDQAIILDTAGRYTIPLDEGPDLEEWKEFLTLLSKYRRREPLNGVIVAIAADKLLAADEQALREEGQSIRQRIDQMMRTMGARFPVYVLITKMDLVHGFAEFNRALPPASLSQAMGYTNTTFKLYWREVMDEALAGIGRSLQDLRFLLVHHKKEPEPGLLIFPNEFKRLTPGLTMFLEGVFAENLYQENPLFRGLYFASALRQGAPSSEFLQITGIKPATGQSKESGEGLFLKDFFAAILPRDRDLFTPIREFTLWRRLTRSLGLSAWVLLCLAFAGLLGFSYLHNRTIIEGFAESFYRPPALEENQAANLLTLDRMRLEIMNMKAKEGSRFLPRFGLNHSSLVVERLKKDYLQLFGEQFLLPQEERLLALLAQKKHLDDDEFVDFLAYVVAQTEIIDAHLAGQKMPFTEDEFRVIATNLILDIAPGLLPEIGEKFGAAYLAYLHWNPDQAQARSRLAEMRSALVNLLQRRGSDLRWLAGEKIAAGTGVHLNEFWGASTIGEMIRQIYVPGAFTGAGRQNIDDFIAHIETALGTDRPWSGEQSGGRTALAGRSSAQQMAISFQEQQKEFWSWYRQEFYHAWFSFLQNFHQVEDRLHTQSEWQRPALTMTGEDNPYFRLLERAAREIKALDDDPTAPSFARLLLQLDEVRHLARQQREKQQSLVATVETKAATFKETVERQIAPQRAEQLATNLRLAAAWNDYLEALATNKVGVSDFKDGYDTYRQAFPATGQAPAAESSLRNTYDAYLLLKNMLAETADATVVWDLVFGPQDFLLDYSAIQTACYLQSRWEEQVLGPLRWLDPQMTSDQLFAPDEGLVWKFLEQEAGPFVGQTRGGYSPRRDFRGNRLPLEPQFFHFLNQGRKLVTDRQPDYLVEMTTLPIAVNPEAKVLPHAAILRVNCSEGSLLLENYNYPHQETFTWSPEKCGDVSLRIEFPSLTLEKNYRGQMAFAQFLADFSGGSRTFSVEEFPRQQEHLRQLGVSEINLTYIIKGGEEVVRLLTQQPDEIPAEIIVCPFKS